MDTMDTTTNSDKHSIIPSSSSSSTTTATPSSSSSSSYTSNQHKIKRLKILQEIEDRKFQLNYNRLMKEQNKICKQLDIQRLQFTRRFSETNFNLSLDELPCKLLKNDNIILDVKKFKQQPPPPQQQQPSPQQQRSITINDHVHSYYDLNSQDNIHDNDYLNQPFWLRLRSLGVPSDEDTLLAALTCKNMNIDNQLESNHNEDDVFESNCKSSIINNQLTRRISRNIEKQRSSSVTGADEILKNVLTNNNNNNNNIKRIKRSLSLEEKTPNWLVTLNQMKRDKLSRTNSNKQEEITALFKGNKFYGNNKRSNVLTIKYQSRNDRLIKSHRHTIVGITHEFTPL
ncbi:unnamed protein product [Schistosoma guineensis]|nr:unnamed protein product [Schistosoma guineensis]